MMDDLIHPNQMTFTDAVGKHQRTGQSVTSRAAAVDAVPLTGSKRQAVFHYIQEQGWRGATDEEIQNGLSMNPSTQRPRRVELVDRGLIQDSGRTRLTRSRRAAVVWWVP